MPFNSYESFNKSTIVTRQIVVLHRLHPAKRMLSHAVRFPFKEFQFPTIRRAFIGPCRIIVVPCWTFPMKCTVPLWKTPKLGQFIAERFKTLIQTKPHGLECDLFPFDTVPQMCILQSLFLQSHHGVVVCTFSIYYTYICLHIMHVSVFSVATRTAGSFAPSMLLLLLWSRKKSTQSLSKYRKMPPPDRTKRMPRITLPITMR